MINEEKASERLTRKLRTENGERCLNCTNFSDCQENMAEIAICEKFNEIKIEDQAIVVGLAEYSRLKGTKNTSLC